MGRSENERHQLADRRKSGETLSSPERHRLVRYLRDRGERVGVADLVDELTPGPGNDPTDRATEAIDRRAEKRRVRIRLNHVDLPKLADEGVIVWDRADRTVRLADEPARAPGPGSDRHVESEPIPAVADPQRRTILAILRETTSEFVSRAYLARELAARTDDAGDGAIERLTIHLHHCHLPKLEEAGFIHYDSEIGTVSHAESTRPTVARSAE